MVKKMVPDTAVLLGQSVCPPSYSVQTGLERERLSWPGIGIAGYTLHQRQKLSQFSNLSPCDRCGN